MHTRLLWDGTPQLPQLLDVNAKAHHIIFCCGIDERQHPTAVMAVGCICGRNYFPEKHSKSGMISKVSWCCKFPVCLFVFWSRGLLLEILGLYFQSRFWFPWLLLCYFHLCIHQIIRECDSFGRFATVGGAVGAGEEVKLARVVKLIPHVVGMLVTFVCTWLLYYCDSLWHYFADNAHIVFIWCPQSLFVQSRCLPRGRFVYKWCD